MSYYCHTGEEKTGGIFFERTHFTKTQTKDQRAIAYAKAALRTQDVKVYSYTDPYDEDSYKLIYPKPNE